MSKDALRTALVTVSPARKSTDKFSTEIRVRFVSDISRLRLGGGGVGATPPLDFDGGMVEAEALLELSLYVSHHAVGILRLADHGMQRDHAPALGDRPDMNVMHVLHALDVCDEV